MLRRAVDVFGFHLAGLDLRQNSDVHALTIGELFEQAGIGLSYTDLPEPERTALLRRELTSARPLASPFLTYSERTASELKILGEAAQAHRRYGKPAVPNYVISKTDGDSDLLEAAMLLKEAGLLRPRDGELDINIVPLFETITDLRNSGRIMDEVLGLPGTGGLWRAAGEPRRSCSGTPTATRTENPDLRLGTLQGRNPPR